MGASWSKVWAWVSQTWNRIGVGLSQLGSRVWVWLAQIVSIMQTWSRQFFSRSWAWLGQNAAQLRVLGLLALIIGIIFIVSGFQTMHRELHLTGEQIRLAVISQTQALTFQEISKINRELTLKLWEDSKLRPILEPSAKNTDPKKVDGFVVMLIQHYATVFRQWQQGNIAQDNWEELAIGARQFFKSPEVRRCWLQVRDFYQEDFQDFVEKTPQR